MSVVIQAPVLVSMEAFRNTTIELLKSLQQSRTLSFDHAKDVSDFLNKRHLRALADALEYLISTWTLTVKIERSYGLGSLIPFLFTVVRPDIYQVTAIESEDSLAESKRDLKDRLKKAPSGLTLAWILAMRVGHENMLNHHYMEVDYEVAKRIKDAIVCAERDVKEIQDKVKRTGTDLDMEECKNKLNTLSLLFHE